MLAERVGFVPATTTLTRARCTPSLWSIIQKPDVARELPVCPAPARDPCLDAKEVEVAAREIRPNLSEMAAVDGPQSVLRNSQRHRDLADPSCATDLGAPRAQRVPANRVFAAIEVRLYARKRRNRRTSRSSSRISAVPKMAQGSEVSFFSSLTSAGVRFIVACRPAAPRRRPRRAVPRSSTRRRGE